MVRTRHAGWAREHAERGKPDSPSMSTERKPVSLYLHQVQRRLRKTGGGGGGGGQDKRQ